MFLKLAVAMRGGGKPSVFDNHGETVLLTVAGDIYRSLGEVVDEPPGPALARRGRIDLPAEETLQKQFLFELPAAAGQAVLAIQGFRSLRFTLPPRPDDDPQATGTFIETPPRNLKPLLTQPIMQAIQQAVDHRMLIKDQAGELIVSIPEARVRGRLRPKRNGLYEGTLRRDQATLPVWLRYVKSPSLVILYLSERPMYQLSYRLKDTPEPDFSDEVADPERPQFFGQ
jgi:hypothetical protein